MRIMGRIIVRTNLLAHRHRAISLELLVHFYLTLPIWVPKLLVNDLYLLIDNLLHLLLIDLVRYLLSGSELLLHLLILQVLELLL